LNYDRTIRQIPEGRPIDALLAAYAAKTLPPPLAALVAAHLELKPDNHAYVTALEAVHGVFLEELKPVPLAGRDRRLVNIFSSPSVEPAPAAKSSPQKSSPQKSSPQKSSPQKSSPPMARPVSAAVAMLPRALRRLAGGDVVDMPWRNRGSGIKEVVLPDDGCAAVRFVSVAPGVRVPIAREDAAAALLLAGAASDRAGYYERGDIVFADAEGGPTAEGEGDCVAFIVAEAPAKSPGRLSRVLHLVMGA
jgi:putative transcriptional regulator